MSSRPEESNSNTSMGTSRREFLRTAAVSAAATAAAAAAAPAKSSVYSLAPSRVIGANERIGIGHVGLGVQGWGAHVRLLKQSAKDNNTQQVAVCDLYVRRQRRSAGEIGGLKESDQYLDFRKMLERKDVDAVVVATSDQWHAPIALAAMEAGKHVYVEKPMCKTLEEAFALYDTVKKTGRKLQVGAQYCTNPAYKDIHEIIKSGKIGTLIMGQHSYNRGDNKLGEWNDYGDNPFKAPAEGQPDHRKAGPMATGDDYIDWETFRKGTQPSAWDPDRFFRFRKYWEYGSGLVGDLMPHKIYPLMIAMGIPTTGMDGFPKRVSCGGGLYVQKVNPDTGKPDREVPDFTYVTADFGDSSMIIMSTSINEQGMRPMIRGNKATIFFSTQSAKITPEKTYSDEIDADNVALHDNGDKIEEHHKNWFDAIRNNTEPSCNADVAVRGQVMITLGELAYRNNQTFTFDPKTRKATPETSKFPPA